MPRLVVVKGPRSGFDIEVTDRPIVFGRLASCDVALEDAKVSRRHARVEPREDGQFEVVDLGSANGTYVNGTRIERRRLYGGDVISLGGNEIRFRADVARAARATAAPGPDPSRGSAATGVDGPGDIRMRDEPLQFSPHRDAGTRSLLRQDLWQEGGPLRAVLVLTGVALLVASALGTAWLTRALF